MQTSATTSGAPTSLIFLRALSIGCITGTVLPLLQIAFDQAGDHTAFSLSLFLVMVVGQPLALALATRSNHSVLGNAASVVALWLAFAACLDSTRVIARAETGANFWDTLSSAGLLAGLHLLAQTTIVVARRHWWPLPDADLRPACATCGYCLRGLPEPRCPECGAEFDPDAMDRQASSSVDAKRARWRWAAAVLATATLIAIWGMCAWIQSIRRS